MDYNNNKLSDKDSSEKVYNYILYGENEKKKQKKSIEKERRIKIIFIILKKKKKY